MPPSPFHPQAAAAAAAAAEAEAEAEVAPYLGPDDFDDGDPDYEPDSGSYDDSRKNPPVPRRGTVGPPAPTPCRKKGVRGGGPVRQRR